MLHLLNHGKSDLLLPSRATRAPDELIARIGVRADSALPHPGRRERAD